jgi:hypothetical protein
MMFGFTPNWSPPTVDSTNPAALNLSQSLESARNNAASALEKASGVMRKHYDARRNDSDPLKIGSKVWLEGTNITPFRPMKKLAEKRYGPFTVLEKVGSSSYKIEIPKTWKGIHPVFNETLLTPLREPLATQNQLAPPPIVQPDELVEYEVEEILDSRRRRNKQFYLVKWQGYGHEENTWEPLSNLGRAKDALAAYKESVRK